jgi:hypothetical protein
MVAEMPLKQGRMEMQNRNAASLAYILPSGIRDWPAQQWLMILLSQRLVLSLMLMVAVPVMALADNTMVLVESVSSGVPGVTAMSYVNAGTEIELGHSGVIVLDHLAACSRETVTGGSLRVGAQGSQVNGGRIVRSQLGCDGQQLQLAASESTGGGQVYRTFSGPLDPQTDMLDLRSTQPVILATQSGTLHITRIDQAASLITITVTAASASQPTAIDMSRLHLVLAPGAMYCISLGQQNIKFRVDPAATVAQQPLMARLLPI